MVKYTTSRPITQKEFDRKLHVDHIIPVSEIVFRNNPNLFIPKLI